MNWLDGAIVVLVLWFTISAFQAGFIRETVTVMAAVVGVALAGVFYLDFAKDVLLFIDNQQLARIVAFGIIFGATALAGQIFALVLKPTVALFQLGIFDQLMGAMFGFAKALVFVEAFLVLFVTYPRWDLKSAINDSLFGSMLMDKTPVVTRLLPDEFRAGVDNLKANVPASLPDVPYQPEQ